METPERLTWGHLWERDVSNRVGLWDEQMTFTFQLCFLGESYCWASTDTSEPLDVYSTTQRITRRPRGTKEKKSMALDWCPQPLGPILENSKAGWVTKQNMHIFLCSVIWVSKWLGWDCHNSKDYPHYHRKDLDNPMWSWTLDHIWNTDIACNSSCTVFDLSLNFLLALKALG